MKFIFTDYFNTNKTIVYNMSYFGKYILYSPIKIWTFS